MDVYVTRRGQPFVWDSEKAASNIAKHDVSFDDACEVFFDFGVQFVDASVEFERREAAIGLDTRMRSLFVVNLQLENDCIRIISARLADARERRLYEDNA
jgi:uncharacterized DUF497 family protein